MGMGMGMEDPPEEDPPREDPPEEDPPLEGPPFLIQTWDRGRRCRQKMAPMEFR